MINLLAILKRFHVQILFLGLMTMGLVVTLNQKNYQKTKFINSANSISGGTYKVFSNAGDYLDLKSVNEQLASENAFLRSQLKESLKKVNGDYYQVDDTLFKQKYVYRVASVINNTVNHRNNYLTLDLGSEDGVMEEMGVISGNGIVGVVGAVTNNYSTVVSFLHPNTAISCKIKRIGVAGILKWDGGDIRYAEIKDIPITTKVMKGDTIVSSGFSFIYPSGLFLGKIIEVENDLENQTQKIKVDLDIDFSALSKVYVVENLFKEELEELGDKQDALDGK